MAVLWDIFQVIMGHICNIFQVGGRCSSFMGHVPGKVGNGSPLAQFPGRRGLMFPGKVDDGSPLQYFPGRRSLLYSFQVKLAMGHLCNIFQVGEVKAEQLKRADGSGD